VNKQKLDYYLNLNYPVEYLRIPEEEGGGYCAYIRQLGKAAFLGDGETIEEAIADLQVVKEFLFQDYLEKGIDIPEPVEEEMKSYSGRFVLRIPADLHRELAEQAERTNTTLNQYCLMLLSQRMTRLSMSGEMELLCQRMKDMVLSMQSMQYLIEGTNWNVVAEQENIYDIKCG
jgi:predicted HicB family RNase H-like nuclease